MVLQIILVFIIIANLRKSLNKDGLLPQWNNFINGGIFAGVVLITLYFAVPKTKIIAEWLGYAVLFVLVYMVYTREAFRSAKPLVIALLPLVALNLIENLVKLVDRGFYREWDTYFEVAQMFALVWMIAMLVINSKQKKALEKERLKNEEKEREYRITEKLKAELEVQVRERTAEITKQKEALQETLNELKTTQTQLVQSEKMASLGELTAGIAHEIQNPLNFVNNFSEINTELIAEMKAAIDNADLEEVRALANDIEGNEKKINLHGKRADAIVKGMLQHSRSSSGQKEPTNINALADEYLRLAYHGLRAKDKTFNATLKTAFDESIAAINIIPQDIGRVILNLITNAFYAVTEKKKQQPGQYEPTVWVSTSQSAHSPGKIQVTVKDNGAGIPAKVLDKIFQPFFTTKPTGQGTGLGLSMSYDIITKGHGGTLVVQTRENEGSTFTITLPV